MTGISLLVVRLRRHRSSPLLRHCARKTWREATLHPPAATKSRPGVWGGLIDTAAIYSDWVPGEVGRSESVIGEWLRARPNSARPRIATKGGHPLLSAMSTPRLDRNSLVADVDASLSRLGVERLDVYYLHRDDETLPIADILGPIADLSSAGKIDSFGLSNWKSSGVQSAIDEAIVPIDSVQVFGNILGFVAGELPDPSLTRLDAITFRQAEVHGLSLILYTSQCQGFFSRWPQQPEKLPAQYQNVECDAVALKISKAAAEPSVRPAGVALAYLLAFSENLFPTVGAKTST